MWCYQKVFALQLLAEWRVIEGLGEDLIEMVHLTRVVCVIVGHALTPSIMLGR